MICEIILLSDLKKRAGKNIYCFGVGVAFDNFINEFSEYKLENNIRAIVDNNSEKINKKKKIIHGISIPIISVGEMLKKIKDDDYILITTASYKEVICQLEKIEILKKNRCYIYMMLRIEQYDYDRLQIKIPEKLSTTSEIQIPKIIHYCWFGKKEIPDQYKKWMESWRHFCPDYEIIEWNEYNYDIHKSKYISQAYEQKKWAFVSDYARIDIINQYGGIYLDTDVELIKNIDELLKNSAFCGFESSKYIAYGLGFGSKKNNPILDEIKYYYDTLEFILDDGSLNQVTCPVIQTEIMKKHGLKCNGEFQTVNGMTVYPSRILCGMSPHSFRIERNPVHTYAIHHFEGSWLDDKNNKDALISNIKKWSKNDNYIYSNL